MSEDQKISIEQAIRIWGTVITFTVTILTGLIAYIYIEGRSQQKEINKSIEIRFDDVSRFQKQQEIINSSFMDVFTYFHPEAQEKLIQTMSKYEMLNKRSIK